MRANNVMIMSARRQLSRFVPEKRIDNEHDDISEVPRISLDEFYSSISDHTLSDEEALQYMTFSAKMSMVKFKDEEEMLSFKGDFQAALAFIQKLDEIDVREVEPLGNVLEFYGGNDSKMRSEQDYRNQSEDQMCGLNFKQELIKLNKHVKGNYVVLNRTNQLNLEGDPESLFDPADNKS